VSAVADPAAVIAAARGWMGTPYHDQASVRGVGCDCLGLARGIWREVVGEEPFDLPAYGRGWGETGASEVMAEGARRAMIEIDAPRDLQPGAALIFRMRSSCIAKHVGILTDAETLIHAYERRGVIEQPLDRGWRRRIAFAFLYPASS